MRGALYQAITSRGLKVPKGLLGLDHGSNLAKNKRYDQILVAPHFPDAMTGRAGVLDVYKSSFQPLYRGIATRTDIQLTYEISDHLPLWLELATDHDSSELEQIVNAKKR